jgi:hypothetical protein
MSIPSAQTTSVGKDSPVADSLDASLLSVLEPKLEAIVTFIDFQRIVAPRVIIPGLVLDRLN